MATMKKIRFGKHKYYAKEVIGKGQFGVVYYAKARKRRKDNGDKIPKYVAIKEYYYSRFYDPSTKQNSCEEYFNREIKCTAIQSKYSGASLNLIDSGKIISKSNKEYYIVLSYIEGKPLDKWFADSFGKHPHLDDDEINFFTNNIIIPLARHLNFCHSKGLVHRDLSIDNIMIKSPQKGAVIPVIIDWGAAKVRKLSEIMHPPKGYMQNQIMSNTAFVNKGTPPEIRRGYPPMAASDIYMLGHIMYYLYGGGVSSRPPKTVDDYVLHPKDNNPQLDSRYDQLVAKCTQYNPSDRIENMEEILHVLEKIQDDFSPSRITFFGKPKSFGRSAPPVKSISSGTNTAGKAYSNKPKSQRSPVQARSSGKPSKNPSDTSAKKRGKKPGAHPINYAHLGEGAKSAKKKVDIPIFNRPHPKDPQSSKKARSSLPKNQSDPQSLKKDVFAQFPGQKKSHSVKSKSNKSPYGFFSQSMFLSRSVEMFSPQSGGDSKGSGQNLQLIQSQSNTKASVSSNSKSSSQIEKKQKKSVHNSKKKMNAGFSQQKPEETPKSESEKQKKQISKSKIKKGLKKQKGKRIPIPKSFNFNVSGRIKALAKGFITYFENPKWQYQRQDYSQYYEELFEGCKKALEMKDYVIHRGNISNNVYIVGRTIGSLNDLRVILNYFKNVLTQSPDIKFVFLGNYFSLNRFDIESFTLLLSYKCLYPNNFYLLRGYRETENSIQKDGLFSHLKFKFGGYHNNIYRLLSGILTKLDLIYIADLSKNARAFIASGGIPFDPKNPQVPIDITLLSQNISPFSFSLNKMDEISQTIIRGKPNELTNSTGRDSRGHYLFSWDQLQSFLRRNQLHYVFLSNAEKYGHRAIWNKISLINSSSKKNNKSSSQAKIIRLNSSGTTVLNIEELKDAFDKDY